MRIALRKRKLMASKNIQNIINPRKRLPETEYKPKVTYKRFNGNNPKTCNGTLAKGQPLPIYIQARQHEDHTIYLPSKKSMLYLVGTAKGWFVGPCLRTGNRGNCTCLQGRWSRVQELHMYV